MSAVYYPGPNANTVIPVTSSGTMAGQKYSMHTLHPNGTAHAYVHNNPQYSPGPTGDATTIAVPQQGHMISDHVTPRWSWCSTVWSVISMCLFASLCGFFGLLCSVFSYVDHKAGDLDGAKRKRQWSWTCTAIGMVLTVMGAIAVILVFIVFYDELEELLNEVGYDKD